MYVYMYHCIYACMAKRRAFQLHALYQVFLPHARICRLSRSILLVLYIKKYDYMYMAVIYVYASIYMHTYVGLKAPRCPKCRTEKDCFRKLKTTCAR